MPKILLFFVVLIGVSELLAGPARAQGAPPFALGSPGSSSQSVVIVPSAKSDDGSHEIEVFPSDYPGEARSQASTYAKTGRLWTIPGSVAYIAFPGGANEFGSAPLPNDTGFRSFLVFEDPVAVPGPTAPFRLLGQHVFDAQCSTATCGYLDGGLSNTGGAIRSEAESSFNLPSGTVSARAEASTPAYGRRYFDASPSGGDIYNHVVEATGAANLQDWVYVTGSGATATLVVSASVSGTLDTPFAPVNPSDWITSIYGDIRTTNPCTDEVLTSNEVLRPSGLRKTELEVAVQISAGYALQGPEWVPSISGASALAVERSADLHWADSEGFPDCSDDVAEVTTSSVGSPASSISVQRVVPTNQWAHVSIDATSHALCEGPFFCDLDASAPAHVSVTSPDGTLVAWQGIAGLTPVPEPSGGLVPAIAAFAWLARRSAGRAKIRPREERPARGESCASR
ncbi:MAG: hypothetical protein IPK00_25010 [Deltaproteobacteria bacterium]|nr:hypothetical protein [Deltaproteobacteria bacterium]